MTPAAAETLALRVLAHLAERPEMLGGLLGSSGMAPGDLRAAAATPEFLGFVLDHVLEDETRARDCAEGLALSADALLRARLALPGGEIPHWT